jgi:DNA-binding FadR family transcriptional regulator
MSELFFAEETVYKPIQISCVYEQVRLQIENLILNGTLRLGDRLPSERELARRLGVCRESVREGIKKLHDNGLVQTLSHRGTFVAVNAAAPPAKPADAHNPKISPSLSNR